MPPKPQPTPPPPPPKQPPPPPQQAPVKKAAPPQAPAAQQKPTPPPQPKAPAPPPKAPTPPKPSAPPAQPPVVNLQTHHPMVDAPPIDVAGQVLTYSPSGTLVEPLAEHVRYFEKLIDEANRNNAFFQGADYKEFADSKLDIDDIDDEALKYQTAYNVLKGSGLTRDKLLSTGQEYIHLIGRDLNAFQGAYSIKYRQEVRPKEAHIQQKAAELQALAQKMNALKAEINQLTQELNLAKEKLGTTKASFLLAGENKQQEIETDMQKIARYF